VGVLRRVARRRNERLQPIAARPSSRTGSVKFSASEDRLSDFRTHSLNSRTDALRFSVQVDDNSRAR
jgi:hypothetical protein